VCIGLPSLSHLNTLCGGFWCFFFVVLCSWSHPNTHFCGGGSCCVHCYACMCMRNAFIHAGSTRGNVPSSLLFAPAICNDSLYFLIFYGYNHDNFKQSSYSSSFSNILTFTLFSLITRSVSATFAQILLPSKDTMIVFQPK
jgi:hypothetical protein